MKNGTRIRAERLPSRDRKGAVAANIQFSTLWPISNQPSRRKRLLHNDHFDLNSRVGLWPASCANMECPNSSRPASNVQQAFSPSWRAHSRIANQAKGLLYKRVADNIELRLALFGGTFDPIHCAHVTVAAAAADRFALDRVLFVPAANPPHKPTSPGVTYEDRLRMVELACEADPRFEASRLEEGREKSYSILTIEKVVAPDRELFFLIGSDAFAEIRTWYRWQDVVRLVEFIVVTRPGHEYEKPPGARVHELDGMELPVSSSELRQKLSEGVLPDDLPAAVASYIAGHQLYGFHPTTPETVR